MEDHNAQTKAQKEAALAAQTAALAQLKASYEAMLAAEKAAQEADKKQRIQEEAEAIAEYKA